MRNKIIFIVSIILILITVIVLFNTIKNDSSPGEFSGIGSNNTFTPEDSRLTVDEYTIIGDTGVSKKSSKKILDDRNNIISGINNEIYAFSTELSEEGLPDQYSDIISKYTDRDVGLYWVVPISDDEEMIYWYNESNELQSYNKRY